MTPERWQQVERVYQAVVARPEAERGPALVALCGPDTDLRNEVESLLAQAGASAFLETPAVVEHASDGLLVGQRVGSYVVTGRLGSGGMGEVYRARDEDLRRDVALKILPDAFRTDPERRARLEREARVLAALNHPHIGAIYGLEDIPAASGSGAAPARALVLELVEGPTLAEVIAGGHVSPERESLRSSARASEDPARRGSPEPIAPGVGPRRREKGGAPRPLEMKDALAVALQVAEALEAAHESGIVHRDLKPANIKVTASGAVKVLDFGLAKLTGRTASAPGDRAPTITVDGTEPGVIVGTAAYMSPEQARGLPVDKRTDIWAFGCVLYELLTGRRAFEGEDNSAVLARVLERDPDLTVLPAATPPAIRRLLRRCLEKDRKRRLPDIAAARLEIEEGLTELAAPAASQLMSERVSSAPAGTVGVLKYRYGRWGLSFVAMLGLALAVGYWVRGGDTSKALESVRLQIALPDNTKVGEMGGFAVSPDGRTLVFAATGADNVTRLWVRALDAIDARPLLGSEGTTANYVGGRTFWSPDSRFVAFYAGGRLKKVDITGGSAQDVSEAATCDICGGSWSREGVILFVEFPSLAIMRVSAAGGTPVPVTQVDPSRKEYGHVLPVFLPDGRHFLFFRRSRVFKNTAGLYVGDVKARPDQQSTTSLVEALFGATFVPPATSAGPGHVVFQRGDGTLMAQPFDDRTLTLSEEPRVVAEHVGSNTGGGYFSASHTGVLVYRIGSPAENRILTWVDRHGNPLARLGDPGAYASIALSPDDSRVAVPEIKIMTADRDLWIVDVGTGRRTRLTFGPEESDWPVWSPDGRRLVFASGPVGYVATKNLFQIAADGSGQPEALLDAGDIGGREIAPIGWSNDGRFLLFRWVDRETKSSDLFVLPVADDSRGAHPSSTGRGTSKPIPFLRTTFNEDDGRFSPDGRWVAYDSDESGRPEIYVRGFSPGAPSAPRGKWPVSKDGGVGPVWRGDGKELFYVSLDQTMMAVSVTAGDSFQAGTPTPLFNLSRFGATGGYVGVTADGKRFLIPIPEQQNVRAPFTVVLNWQAGLKK